MFAVRGLTRNLGLGSRESAAWSGQFSAVPLRGEMGRGLGGAGAGGGKRLDSPGRQLCAPHASGPSECPRPPALTSSLRRARCGLGGAAAVPAVTQQTASCCARQGLRVPRSARDLWCPPPAQDTRRHGGHGGRRALRPLFTGASRLPRGSPVCARLCPTWGAEAR